MKNKLETMEKISDFHINFAKNIMLESGRLTPMIAFMKDKKLLSQVLVGAVGREEIKVILELTKAQNPEWFVVMHEAYMKQFDIRKVNPDITKTMQHGDIKREFEMGFDDVKECVVVNTYMGDKQLFSYVPIEKKDGKIIGFGKPLKTKNAEGFLT